MGGIQIDNNDDDIKNKQTFLLLILNQFTEYYYDKKFYSVILKSYLIDIIFSIKSKGKREDIVFLVVRATVVEHILWRNALPTDLKSLHY